MFKNKSPFSHNNYYHQQPRSPLSTDNANSNLMFTQTLALNKNRANHNISNQNISNPSINSNCYPFAMTTAFSSKQENNNFQTLLFKKPNHGTIDIDLECDEVLIKNKSNVDQQIDFMCNEELIPPLPKVMGSKQFQGQTRRIIQKRQFIGIGQTHTPPSLDLKCNQDLNDKQNIGNLEQVHTRVKDILQYYQRVILQQQDQIKRLQAEKEALTYKIKK